MSSIFAPMKIEDIGSGRAERRVRINGRQCTRGDELSHADLASMATANRNAMIENRMITVFPKSVSVRGGFGASHQASAAIEGDYHVVAKGFGKYDVIRGTALLEGATKDAAAEFVAAERAKAPGGAQAAASGPGKAKPKASKPGRKASGRRRRGTRPAPPPAAPGDNGPIE